MNKKEISMIFEDIALMLELAGENPFKIKAYINGARILELLDGDIEDYVKEGKLSDIKGIGKALSDKIEEMVNTGRLRYFEELKASIPEGLFEILKIPGIGPKKAKALFEKLGIETIHQLENACIEGNLVGLEGFGEKTQENILKGIEYLNNSRGQYLFSEVFYEANIIKKMLKNYMGTIRCEIAGSLRRKKETVKDIDILVSTNNPKELTNYFVSIPYIEEVISRGETKTSVRLKNGINMDMRVIDDTQYPYALHHFTGSKEHNTAIRHRAKAMNIKVNEYGLFKDDIIIPCKDENDIFNILGLVYIPPELRENNGEIEAAENGFIPKLVETDDIVGLLHLHTNYSDGSNTVLEYAEEALKLGMNYIGITDHSQAAFYANGLSEDKLNKQFAEIDQFNLKHKNFKIYKGIECEILADGNLDYNDEILSKFDFVIASVHSNFKMNRRQMTDRIISALKNRYTTILGHPTGRLLLSRDEYEVDIYSIIDAAAQYGKIIELNADPHRLDLDWRYLKYAKEKGVRISINPDAHSLYGIYNYRHGVGIAKKGWLEKNDVINTMPAKEIEKIFNKNCDKK